MTFDLQAAREIVAKCQCKDDDIDHDYWAAHAAQVLPEAYEEIERQAARIRHLESHLIQERERYIDDFVHEFDECEDRSEEAREQLQSEDKL